MVSMKVRPWCVAVVCAAWIALSPALAHSHAIGESVLTAQSATDLTTSDGAATGDLVIEDLTPEQSAQVEAIIETYKPQIEAAALTYADAVKALVDILLPTTPAADLIDAREAVLTSERDADDLIFERNMAIREVLTVEQRQPINDYLRNGLGL
jgi:Spy/CpxP family protein refolding chaperone